MDALSVQGESSKEYQHTLPSPHTGFAARAASQPLLRCCDLLTILNSLGYCKFVGCFTWKISFWVKPLKLLLFAARQGGHYKLPGDSHRTYWWLRPDFRSRALTRVPSWHRQTEPAWPPEWGHGAVPGTSHPSHSQTKLTAPSCTEIQVT